MAELDELRNELDATRFDSFVDSQLELHTCPICFELMSPPERRPVLLFPCGHTFCQDCVKQSSKCCPLCRAKVESSAINFSLQNAILALSQKKQDLGRSESSQGFSENDSERADLADKYLQQFKMLSLRCKVLSNRLEDVVQSTEEARKGERSSRIVITHLRDEEEKVEKRLRAVQSELDLVRGQRRQQEAKLDESLDLQQRTADSIRLIEQTLVPLERDRDKAKLLLSRLIPDRSFDDDDEIN